MECREVETLEPLYMGSELPQSEKQRLDAHLLDCTECSRAYEMAVALDDLLRDTVVHRRIDESKVISTVRTQIASERPAKNRTKAWVLALVPLMAILLLTAGAYLIVRQVERPANLFTDAVADHFQEVTQRLPVEWTTDPAVMRKLLEDWVKDPSIADSLTPPGFHLSRMRLCELMNRNYLHLVYSNGGQDLSVFLRRRDGESLPGQEVQQLNNSHSNASTGVATLHMARHGQVEVAGFQTPVVTVLFVGNIEKNALQQIAVHVADSL